MPHDKLQDDQLLRDLSINEFDIVKLNRNRFASLNFAFNQNKATVFLGVGLHFDKISGRAFPVVSGADWIDRDKAVLLLQEALTALNTKIIEDAQNTPKV